MREALLFHAIWTHGAAERCSIREPVTLPALRGLALVAETDRARITQGWVGAWNAPVLGDRRQPPCSVEQGDSAVARRPSLGGRRPARTLCHRGWRRASGSGAGQVDLTLDRWRGVRYRRWEGSARTWAGCGRACIWARELGPCRARVRVAGGVGCDGGLRDADDCRLLCNPRGVATNLLQHPAHARHGDTDTGSTPPFTPRKPLTDGDY